MTGPPDMMVGAPIVLGAQPEQTGQLRYEIRWPDGERLVSRFNRSVDAHKAQLLVKVASGMEEKPDRHFAISQDEAQPSVKMFAGILAQGNFTTTQTGNLRTHR